MTSQAIVGCCAPFTLTAGIILLTLAALMYHENWTFQVIAAKQEWDLPEKASCCLNAGIFYIILSILLWFWLGFSHILGKKWYKRFRRLFLRNSTDRNEGETSNNNINNEGEYYTVETNHLDDNDDIQYGVYQNHREASPLLRKNTNYLSKTF